ncbi:ABC transporter permease [Candidatus Odyssella acanthamoebae]|uniref:ABC transporter permease n=1 Tax=Candidatus Odyssella acanthamoebae TaxID=91604 RepID=A0A077ATT9_9PROT|nr:ABC-2 family transporter protein [Candidatus Paracaedibacter acanthamoebae]AIK96612.1 hypothetical protein ID47_07590 [Candidatus Paracaedibacter acanthamoebae]
MSIKRELLLLVNFFSINLKASIAHRGAFILRLIFMTLSKLIFLVSWFVYFEKFKVVNGWTIYHVTFMYGLVNVSIGLIEMCFNGFKNIPNLIERCELDILLVTPRPIIFSVGSSKTDHAGIGSVIAGIFLIVLSGFTAFTDWLLIFLFVICSIAVYCSISILYGSLSFWFKNLNRLVQDLFNITVVLSTNPNCIYKGFLKLLILSLLPVGLISYYPIDYFLTRSMTSLLVVVCGTSLLLAVSSFIFYKGLRRYESGSLSNMSVK